MNTFNKLLNEALDNTSGVTIDEYVKFATAIITSTSADKIEAAVERALDLSPSELTSIIKQVQFTGDTQALFNAFTDGSGYEEQFLMIGRKILPEEELLEAIAAAEGKEQKRIGVEMSTPYVQGQTYQESLQSTIDNNPCPDCNGKMIWHTEDEAGIDDVVDEDEADDTYVNHLHCPKCDEGWYDCENCGYHYRTNDFNFDVGYCKNCGHGEETYNPETDYYNQGQDAGGH